MQVHGDQRSAVHSINPAVHPLTSTGYGHGIPYGHQFQYNTHGQLYSQAPASSYPEVVSESMDSLASAFGSVNVQGMSSIGSGKPNTATTMPGSHANSQVYYLADGRVLVSNIQTQQGIYQQSSAGFKIAPSQTQLLQQGPYSGFQPGMQIIANTPQAPAWLSSRPKPEEVPDLAGARRSSWSSNEEAGPGTPFYGPQRGREYLGGIAVADHSPNAWSTTPSPQQLTQVYVPPQILVAPDGQHVYADLDAITLKDPAIPLAIPAPFTPGGGRGTLEKSLRNELAVTNVYVRGLHPNTTDEMLHAYGARFGDIQSCKAILDLPAGGMCKGFGFIKYWNFIHGENCIRGFFHRGYEAKWARESHNAKLKTLSDPTNTNLYVSNLPKDMNEAMLAAIFSGYQILSKKIMRDDNGISRGVGFARFESHEICEEVIENFHGKPVGKDGAGIQIRFADTEKQKQLKSSTTQKRQYKTEEYAAAAFGPLSPYQHPSPTGTNFTTPLQTRIQGTNGFYFNQSPIPQFYATYPQPLSNPNQATSFQTGNRVKLENVPLVRARQAPHLIIESPSGSPCGATALKERSVDQANRSLTPDSDDDGAVCTPATAVATSKNDTETSPVKVAI
ncbi:RNA recognition motif domain [Lasallia pustulata]|uniref:RNA recognition motif domain n=1 Tax=Lasallia pustulata TaxID=136370 RepID=A0A1W5DAV6_9LECA|nr:RNA recognition motif domain [Lasallia pustulata]